MGVEAHIEARRRIGLAGCHRATRVLGVLALAFVLALAASACGALNELDIGTDGTGGPVTDGAVADEPVVGDATGGGGRQDAAIFTDGCTAPAADCDGDPATGCETDTLTDRDHCGGCAAACDSPDCQCVDGRRVLACPAGRGDCDGVAGNGCEADLSSDLANCGGCGTVCTVAGREVVSGSCEAGQCVLVCESPGHGDCDGDPANGCEAQLLFDSANCGSCGMVCPCSGGTCM